MLSVDLIGQAVSVEVDAADVKRVLTSAARTRGADGGADGYRRSSPGRRSSRPARNIW